MAKKISTLNNVNESEYLSALRLIREVGRPSTDRTGVGTRRVSGIHMDFDIQEGFPLLTTKKVNFDAIVHELLWFISGDTNVKYLQDNGVKIWDQWCDEKGNLGPIYGKQWRSWNTGKVTEEPYGAGTRRFAETIDQLQGCIDEIRVNPDSRRLVVNSWNVGQLSRMALPPCHLLFQFLVIGDEISLCLYQRSGDMFLGVPFNIASYALLLGMVAGLTGYVPRFVHHTIADAHIYENHLEQVDEQLSRKTKRPPVILFNWADRGDGQPISNINDIRRQHIELQDYDPHPSIAAPVAV